MAKRTRTKLASVSSGGGGGGGVPAGGPGQIQFNGGGSFAASPNLTFSQTLSQSFVAIGSAGSESGAVSLNSTSSGRITLSISTLAVNVWILIFPDGPPANSHSYYYINSDGTSGYDDPTQLSVVLASFFDAAGAAAAAQAAAEAASDPVGTAAALIASAIPVEPAGTPAVFDGMGSLVPWDSTSPPLAPYTPANSGQWAATAPDNVQDALDDIANGNILAYGSTPGGAPGAIQYNGAGAFAGDTALTDGAGNLSAVISIAGSNWQFNGDGSGLLASGGIFWDTSGAMAASSLQFSAGGFIGTGSGTFAINADGSVAFSSGAFTLDASGNLTCLSIVGQAILTSGGAFTVDNVGNLSALTVGAGKVNATEFRGAGSAPTIAAGTGAGTGPTVSVTGTKSSFKVTVITGTLPATGSIIATVTFGAFSAVPNPVGLTPGNAATALLSGTSAIFLTSTTTTVVLTSGAVALTAATNYVWYFHLIA